MSNRLKQQKREYTGSWINKSILSLSPLSYTNTLIVMHLLREVSGQGQNTHSQSPCQKKDIKSIGDSQCTAHQALCTSHQALCTSQNSSSKEKPTPKTKNVHYVCLWALWGSLGVWVALVNSVVSPGACFSAKMLCVHIVFVLSLL